MTRWLLWQEYKAAHPEGWQYSVFCEQYRRWLATQDPVLRQQHEPGDKLFVDYAGQTVPVTDRYSGKEREAQIFVAVLGCSNYSYAEAAFSQQLPDWLGAQVRALEYFGGVPAAIVPDNLKSAVQRAHRYEPALNPSYQDFAEHYAVAILPARVRKPRDKAKVEAGVLIVERWILARLRNRSFFSLGELNAAIAELLEVLNTRPFKKLEGCRRSRFIALDAPALRPLPAKAYEFGEWRRAKVHPDYHIEVKRAYYSVPYRLIGRQVDVRLTAHAIEIFHAGKLVAAHVRSNERARRSTRSGNEAFSVDAVGQVAWSGKGTSVDGSTTTCDTAVTAAAKITNTYDNLGNIRIVNYGDASPDKTYTYDKNSRLKTLSAGSLISSFAYNSAGLPISESLAVGGNTFNVGYSYNSLKHLASLTYPSTANVAFLPNAFGQPTKAGTYATGIAYHPNGAIQTLTYGNTGTARVYTTTQNARRLPEYLKVMAGSTTISNLRYLYDANGNITTITDAVTSAASRTLGYDGLDRLSSASGLWGSGSYTYDILGNLKSKTEGGQAMSYQYNTTLNRLTGITGANARTFSYDAYGNVTNNGVQGFSYNLAGQMVGSTLPTVAYQYDGFDRRVVRTEGGQTVARQTG